MTSSQSTSPLLVHQVGPVRESGELAHSSPLALEQPTDGGANLAIEPGSPVALLPVELDVVVPVREFRVSNLLALEPGQVIATQWGHGEDVPLAAGQVQLAWSEFEVVDSWLGVRVTRLA